MGSAIEGLNPIHLIAAGLLPRPQSQRNQERRHGEADHNRVIKPRWLIVE